MNLEVRAVIMHDGRLVVSRERRFGEERLSLPGGRVERRESVEAALEREVLEETGLSVVVGRLLYVFEVLSRVELDDLNLVFLAEPADASAEARLAQVDTVDVTSANDVLPPITDLISGDLGNQWAETPRWLGNIWERGWRRSTDTEASVDSERA